MGLLSELLHKLLNFVKLWLFRTIILTILSLFNRTFISINLLTNKIIWCIIKLSSNEYFICWCPVHGWPKFLCWLCWNWYLAWYCSWCPYGHPDYDSRCRNFTSHFYNHFMESGRLVHNYRRRFLAMYILYSPMGRFICYHSYRGQHWISIILSNQKI